MIEGSIYKEVKVEEKKYSEEEIISILTGKLTKGFSMNSVCEELGIIGALLLMSLIVCLCYEIFKIAMTAADMLGAAIATGVLSQAIMPTMQSRRVSITDISPSYETISSVDGITSERSDFDYIYAYGGEG